ncbi:MAG: hypothetical protein AAFO89_15295, partial [Planctomycetota bacterium]
MYSTTERVGSSEVRGCCESVSGDSPPQPTIAAHTSANAPHNKLLVFKPWLRVLLAFGRLRFRRISCGLALQRAKVPLHRPL